MQDNYQNNSSEELEGDAGSEGHQPRVGDSAFLDLTDRKNEDFVYIY